MKFCQRKCGRGKGALFALDFFFYNLAVNLNTPAICIMVSDNILSSFTIRVFLCRKYGDKRHLLLSSKLKFVRLAELKTWLYIDRTLHNCIDFFNPVNFSAHYATDPNNILYRQAVKLFQVTTFWQLDKMTT